MKLLLVLFGLVAYTLADSCYDELNNCGEYGSGAIRLVTQTAAQHEECELKRCNAKYGNVEKLQPELARFANRHFAHNFQYLLLSTHFANYQMNRKGFEKLYRKLADDAWEKGIGLIKYMSKRGLPMDFNAVSPGDKLTHLNQTFQLYEFQSLAKSLDIQKSLAKAANSLHHAANRNPEVKHHIEETFLFPLRDSIRELSGHSNDLKNLLKDQHQQSLNLYLFDEYLQKL